MRNLIKEIEQECEQNRIPYKKDIPIGIMIEVPSAAIAADLYAPAVDFFSIGTNDLIQYTMAADRENQTVAHLADCFQPAVLRLIRHVIETEPLLHRTGDLRGGFVSMCGEMASDTEAVPLLLGMGLRRFSMAAQKSLRLRSGSNLSGFPMQRLSVKPSVCWAPLKKYAGKQ